MKDINEVLRRKETELQQVQREVEALRVASHLLADEPDVSPAYSARPQATVPSYTSPARPTPQSVAAPAGDGGYSASWDAAAKKFP